MLDAPGKVDDLSSDELRKGWTDEVSSTFKQSVAGVRKSLGRTPWLIAPPGVKEDGERDITWNAYPKQRGGDEAAVDKNRGAQDEYCEWAVERNAGGEIVRVVVTTETPDYFTWLAGNDPDRVVQLYKRFVAPDVEWGDLVGPDGSYDPANSRNLNESNDRIMHMAQVNNYLSAAVTLAAAASIPVVDVHGDPVSDEQQLITCVPFGQKGRHSDPHIGAVVNELVRSVGKVSFANPPGLYIHAIRLNAFETPDDSSMEEWREYERGVDGYRTRVVFRPPPGSPYTLSNLKVDDEPLATGGQIAQQVTVRLTGAVFSSQEALTEPLVCERPVDAPGGMGRIG